jgi:hypothetical protein
MIRTFCIRILIIAVLMLGITSNLYCLEMSETANEINNDFEIAFVTDPKESKSIFDKYRDEKYHQIFTQIFSTGKKDDKLLYDIIYINAVLKDGRYLEYVRKRSLSNFLPLEDVVRFYYYRTGYEELASIKFLKRKLDNLLKKPTDSYLITFLAFFDDIDLSLSYMDKLAHVADGATSELLSWAANYLYYKNRNNTAILNKIKKSYSYKYILK